MNLKKRTFEEYELSLYSAATKDSPGHESSVLTTYGLNVLIREYSKFPRWLPLPCRYEHSAIFLGKDDFTFDFKTKKHLMFVSNTERANVWREYSNVPCFAIGSLFSHYRRMKNIKKKETACGTIILPGHSSGDHDSMCDCSIEAFCEEIKALPKEFHPATICLHWNDVMRGKGKIYEKWGFPVVTAGNGNGDVDHRSFLDSFHEILSNHRYTVSNEVGSHIIHAIEMGLPFFFLGQPAIKTHYGNEYPFPSKYTHLYYPESLKWKNIFDTGPVVAINSEQQEFIDKEVGKNDFMPPKQLNRLLWRFFFKDKKLIVHSIKVYTKLFLGGLRLMNPLFVGKKVAKKIISRFGYTLIKTTSSDFQFKIPHSVNIFQQNGFLTYHKPSFLNGESFVSVYSDSMQLYEGADRYSIQWKIHVVLWAASCASKVSTTFVECSVNRGMFAFAIMKYLDWNTLNGSYTIYDTFCSADLTLLDDNDVIIGQLPQSKKMYYNCKKHLETFFDQFENVKFVQQMPEQPFDFSQFEDVNNIGFLIIDMNFIETEIVILDSMISRMAKGGIIILDNYDSSGCGRRAVAFDKFLKKHNCSVLSVPTGQGLVFV